MRRRILIVEDDPIIGMMLEQFVDMLDMDMAGSADSVEKALACISDGGIDAAIVDVHLADGQLCDPVAEALSAADIPFLVATGGFVGDTSSAWQSRPVLEKPFTIDRLSEALDGLR